MKIVQCPYCSVNFETVGFRPINFQCVQCGAEAEWYPGEVDGEPRGLIAWLDTESTQSFLFEKFVSPVFAEINNTEYSVNLSYKRLEESAIKVLKDISKAIEELMNKLIELYVKLAQAQIEGDVVTEAEVRREIQEVIKKITIDQQLLTSLQKDIQEIVKYHQAFLILLSSLKSIMGESFYLMIAIITENNQEDLSSDEPIEEYSSEEDWNKFMKSFRENADKIKRLALNIYYRYYYSLEVIRSSIQRV